MRLRNLFEALGEEVAIIFGRFNPPHKGHRAAWELASRSPIWFVGTNKSTQGPKDPLPFDVKVEAMKTIWPEVEGHIVAETSWLTLASRVYEQYPNATLLCLTDEDWVTKTIVQYNGKEGAHGFYNFKKIEQKATPRLSSATALRAAVEAGNRDAFAQAAGVDADTLVAGKPFFDLVAEYLLPYANAPKKAPAKKKKVVEPTESVSETIVKVKGGYQLQSKKTGKNLGTYPTKAGAEKRERQVQYFKHAHEDVTNESSYTINDFKVNRFESMTEFKRWIRSPKSNNRGMPKSLGDHYANILTDGTIFESNSQLAKRRQEARTFIDKIKQLDQRDRVEIKIGNKIAILSVDVMPSDTNSRIEISGSVNLKEITNIHKIGHEIDFIEFKDGSRFPEASEFTTVNGINITNTLLFSNSTSSSKAFTTIWMYLNKLEGEGWSIENYINEDANPCWKGYKQIGMKNKGGKQVPNCVPKESVEEGTEDQEYIQQIAQEFIRRAKLGRHTADEGTIMRMLSKFFDKFGISDHYFDTAYHKVMRLAGTDQPTEDAAGVGIITKQNTTADVNKGTLRKMMKAYHLTDNIAIDEGILSTDVAHALKRYGEHVKSNIFVELGKLFSNVKYDQAMRTIASLNPEQKKTALKIIAKAGGLLGQKLAGIAEETYEGNEFYEAYGDIEETLEEAEYQGRTVTLNKPMRGDVKKFKVFVKDPSTGNVKKVNFGDPDMKIKAYDPDRRRSFRARHNCDNPGPKTKARYWSCRKW